MGMFGALKGLGDRGTNNRAVPFYTATPSVKRPCMDGR